MEQSFTAAWWRSDASPHDALSGESARSLAPGVYTSVRERAANVGVPASAG
jgi:hypothetical protein